MTYVLFFFGLLSYVAAADVSYTSKSLLFACAIGALTNLLWMLVAKQSSSPDDVFINAVLWDTMIVVAYMVTPFLTGSLKLTAAHFFGAIMILGGIFVVRWHG